MKRIKQIRHNFWLLVPIFGAISFCVLYVLATKYYPGGSQVNKQALVYSWQHNYWCNLLTKTALNGKINTGRPIALLAALMLSFTLGSFWYLFPTELKIQRKRKRFIQFTGLLTVTLAFFIYSSYHDVIIFIASILGVLAMLGTLLGLKKLKWYGLMGYAFLIVVLVVFNFIFYKDQHLILYLPILQKITFALFLIWVCITNLFLFFRSRVVI